MKDLETLHEIALVDDYSRDRGIAARRDRLAHFARLGLRECGTPEENAALIAAWEVL